MTNFHLVGLNSTGWKFFVLKVLAFLSKSAYNEPKAGKMRMKNEKSNSRNPGKS